MAGKNKIYPNKVGEDKIHRNVVGENKILSKRGLVGNRIYFNVAGKNENFCAQKVNALSISFPVH